VSSWPARLVKGFARFWWDFLVGDTPEVFAAVVVVLGLVALLSVAWHENALAVVVFPVLVVATLAATLFRARR
jgi:hypothetical protein